MDKYVIGVDFGTDSVRAVLINAANGKEISTAVHWYRRWKEGHYCVPAANQFRQHPLDHIEGLEAAIKKVVNASDLPPENMVAICIDTTGSSPLPLDKNGTALALIPEFSENPNAMMILWKDHTSINEANEINEISASWGGIDYTMYEGGIYSSEWFWAKILHTIRVDEEVKNAAFTWMEHCDYMTYLLCADKNLTTFKRSRCAAGHKAMWHESWGGLPSEDYLNLFHPYLAELRDRLYDDTFTSDQVAGTLSEEWALKLGLTNKTIIAVGTFDAHAGAVGAKIDEQTLVRVMGTSTCDIMVSQPHLMGDTTVKGICGQVNGSVIPGMTGLEAGQSAFGDLLAWFKDLLLWPAENLIAKSSLISNDIKEKLIEELQENMIAELTRQAEAIPKTEAIPTALDWINGRRTPDANQELKSALSGLSLGTTAPHLFKALINAICFGSKKILDRFESEGVAIKSVTGIGGVARKSPFIMQSLANVLDKPIKIAASDYTPALGAAAYAAVAAGIFPDVISASKVLGSEFETSYFPNPSEVENYVSLMEHYEALATFMEEQSTVK